MCSWEGATLEPCTVGISFKRFSRVFSTLGSAAGSKGFIEYVTAATIRPMQGQCNKKLSESWMNGVECVSVLFREGRCDSRVGASVPGLGSALHGRAARHGPALSLAPALHGPSLRHGPPLRTDAFRGCFPRCPNATAGRTRFRPRPGRTALRLSRLWGSARPTPRAPRQGIRPG